MMKKIIYTFLDKNTSKSCRKLPKIIKNSPKWRFLPVSAFRLVDRKIRPKYFGQFHRNFGRNFGFGRTLKGNISSEFWTWIRSSNQISFVIFFLSSFGKVGFELKVNCFQKVKWILTKTCNSHRRFMHDVVQSLPGSIAIQEYVTKCYSIPPYLLLI